MNQKHIGTGETKEINKLVTRSHLPHNVLPIQNIAGMEIMTFKQTTEYFKRKKAREYKTREEMASAAHHSERHSEHRGSRGNHPSKYMFELR